MANKLVNLTIVKKPLPVSSILPVKEAALFDEMIVKWATRRTGSLHHTQGSVDACIASVKDMLLHVGKAPWYWTEDDFDSWCVHIGVERGLARNTQRNYQTAIRSFFKYIVENIKFKNVVLRDYSIDLKQLCNSENCMPHVLENEKTKVRPAFSHEQIVTFFDAIDLGI